MSDTARPPTAKVSMLIRRPASEVFNALVSPDMLTQYWLSRASGALEVGKTVSWEFMVPGAVTDTTAKELVKDRRLLVEWSDGTTVSWTLQARADGGTVLAVENAGFKGSQAEMLETALASTEGFAIVLCDLKTLLEQGKSARLVRDKAALNQETMAARR